MDWGVRWTKTICPYCGVGCGLEAGSKDGNLVKMRPDRSHPANKGLICAKGATLAQILDTPDRAVMPLVRAASDGVLQPASWDGSLNWIARRIAETIEKHGPDSFAFYISGQLLSEDYYVINKLAKGFIGTNNVDSNSRLCMASAVTGYSTSLGADGPPVSYEDLELARCYFLIGTNTAACHPVAFYRIKARKAADTSVKIIVADPRRTQTADIADLYLPLRPGTDIALLNAMLHVLVQENHIDEAFIRDHTSGWEAAQDVIRRFTPEYAAEICGLEAEDIRTAARWFGECASSLSLWSMGLNQSTSGTAKNNAVINLHLATGRIGKPGSGPFSLTGQPNAMGGRETGGLSHLLPGHRLVANADHRAFMEKFWKVPAGRISPKPGFTAVDLFKSIESGKVKIVWVIATNPAVSMPNAERVKAAFAKAELVIAQDPYHPTETTRLAHVVLPAAQWSEREGTMTNSERRISFAGKLVDPPGEAKPDWWIVAEVARRMGFGEHFGYRCAEDVFEEYKKTTDGTDMNIMGASYMLLKKRPVQWPFPWASSPADKRLYEDAKFGTPDGRACFLAYDYKAPAELPDAEYPFVLTTGRVRDQWHTMTRTGKVPSLRQSEPRAFLEIHPQDAARLGITEREAVEVVTRRGRALVPARITDRIRQGTCFVPFHWGELFGDAVINRATIEDYDPLSKQPELKFCACRLQKAANVVEAQNAS